MMGVTVEEIARAVAAGLRSLRESQEPDGSFALPKNPTRPAATPSDNLFSTAMVLGLLAGQLHPETASRAAAYLLGRREKSGLWSWLPDGTIPPDSDDTACSLGALAALGAPIDREGGVRLLRKFWRLGGPFQTWNVPWYSRGGWRSRDRDDPIVNCNVLWAIERLGGTPRPAERMAASRLVAEAQGPTRYYSSAASIAWAAARVGIPTPQFVRPDVAALVDRALECALWMLAVREPWREGADLLIGMQEEDGGWRAEDWVHDHAGDWQSRAVTTAFAVAALSRESAAG